MEFFSNGVYSFTGIKVTFIHTECPRQTQVLGVLRYITLLFIFTSVCLGEVFVILAGFAKKLSNPTFPKYSPGSKSLKLQSKIVHGSFRSL